MIKSVLKLAFLCIYQRLLILLESNKNCTILSCNPISLYGERNQISYSVTIWHNLNLIEIKSIRIHTEMRCICEFSYDYEIDALNVWEYMIDESGNMRKYYRNLQHYAEILTPIQLRLKRAIQERIQQDLEKELFE